MSLNPATWLEAAQALPEGGTARTTHNCGEGRVLTLDHKITGWAAWCHRCNDDGWVPRPRESLNQRLERLKATRAIEQEIVNDVTPPRPANYDIQSWPLEARVWLYKAGLDNDTIRSLAFYHHANSNRIVLPVSEGGRLTYWQARGFDPDRPKYLNPVSRKGVFRFGPVDGPIVITEDILSAVRVGMSAEAEGWCVMGTSLPIAALNLLSASGRPISVWLDPDAAGRKGAAKMLPSLRFAGLEVRLLRSGKDPKLHTVEEIRSVIRLDSATPAQVPITVRENGEGGAKACP